MGYSLDEIRESNKIFYYLLKNKELKKSEEELYRGYSENENIMDLVKILGEESECYIKKYNGVIYLIPSEENDFLGYSKRELKEIFCGSKGNEKDYYLSQFIILTFLVTMYGGRGKSPRMRDHLKFGEFLNIIVEKLNEGIEKSTGDSGIAFTNILERFEGLKSSEEKSKSRTTKEGFVYSILRFLEEQNLITYVVADEMIFTTVKLNNFMEWDILNKNNYNRVLKAIRGEQYEQNK